MILKNYSLIGRNMETNSAATKHKEEQHLYNIMLVGTYRKGMMELQFDLVMKTAQTKSRATAVHMTNNKRNWLKRTTDLDWYNLGTNNAMQHQYNMQYKNTTTESWNHEARAMTAS